MFKYGAGSGHQYQSLITAPTSDSLIAYFLASGANGNFEPQGPNGGVMNISLGEWHHLVQTYDGDTLRFYLDGILDYEEGIGDSFAQSNWTNFWIGWNGFSQEFTKHFNGVIDDVKIYDCPFTQEEVEILYSIESEPPVESAVEVIDADLVIPTDGKGLILKSPDGQCWRISIDSTGNLTSALVICPD